MKEVALVTGASGGIGEDLARLIAASGRDVVLLARGAAKLQTLADELSNAHKISATVLSVDSSSPGAAEDVTRVLAERRITIDMLINNAGFGTHGAFARDDPAGTAADAPDQRDRADDADEVAGTRDDRASAGADSERGLDGRLPARAADGRQLCVEELRPVAVAGVERRNRRHRRHRHMPLPRAHPHRVSRTGRR